MLVLGKILSIIPVKVGVSGRSGRFVTWLGDKLYNPSKLGKVKHCGRFIDFTGHPGARVIAYATHNFFIGFLRTDLGHFMKRRLKPGDYFVDVGANYGGYSYLAKHMMLDVVNIEPHPEIGGYLASNQEVFGDHLGIGLSDDRGSLNFFISELNPEGHSLVESSLAWGDSGYARKISVQVDSFDQVFENDINNLRVFHLVKVDVEGHEEAVVTGMKNALEKGLVKNLWCEVRGPGSDRNPSSYMGVCQAMTEHGYEPYLYCRGKIKPFDPDSDNIPQYFDLLFMRDE